MRAALTLKTMVLSCTLASAAAGCIPGSIDRPGGGSGFPIDEPPPHGSGGIGMVSPPLVGGAGGSISDPAGIYGGTAVSATRSPPALSGGTLLILRDGQTALAADPDRDALYLADLSAETLLARLPLQAGDEPGRAVEDGAGTVHVVLRGAGALVSVDPRTRTLGARRPVCAAPRGIAYDPVGKLLHVACAGGELLALPPAGGAPVRRAQLGRDLRDVVVSGGKLLVSRFRSAEVITVSAATGEVSPSGPQHPPGSPVARQPMVIQVTAPIPGAPTGGAVMESATPGVAWRLRALPAGGVMMVHQEASNGELAGNQGGYGGGPCKTAIGAAFTTFPEVGSAHTGPQLMFAVLPIDFAVSGDGKRLALVAAGNGQTRSPFGATQLALMNAEQPEGAGCVPPNSDPVPETIELRQPVGEAIAVAFDGKDRVVVQSREPARLEIVSHRGGTIKLSDESVFDTGHAVFHTATFAGLACASCHPEGGEDGRVWRFAEVGPRRTQSLRGGLIQTAPFHWDGDLPDLSDLMTEVFTGRMSGPILPAGHVAALGTWMDRLPALPVVAPADAQAVARGKALFESPQVGCVSCHGGALYTNNLTVDVGTGRLLQVPSLRGVAWRAPFMHTGCATTLTDRFDVNCGGGQDLHGKTSQLAPAALQDLVSFMESL